MRVEETILNFIPDLLKSYDREKTGAAIDIGVGTFNFYWKVFAINNYTTYAIEPLPEKRLLDLANKYNITLVNACVCNKDAPVFIYTGQFRGKEQLNVSSMHNNWWGVGDSSRKVRVAGLTINTLFSKYNIQKVTYLKIDTEGSELSIIEQLVDMKRDRLPLILEFEYGGGCFKKEDKAGWSPEFFLKTVSCLSILSKIGYKYGLLVEREMDFLIDFKLDEIRFEDLFYPDFAYGNIIVFQEKKIDCIQLAPKIMV